MIQRLPHSLTSPKKEFHLLLHITANCLQRECLHCGASNLKPTFESLLSKYRDEPLRWFKWECIKIQKFRIMSKHVCHASHMRHLSLVSLMTWTMILCNILHMCFELDGSLNRCVSASVNWKRAKQRLLRISVKTIPAVFKNKILTAFFDHMTKKLMVRSGE